MKTWLITGCSSGLGRGIAEAALKHGENVAVTARNIEQIKALAEQYPVQAQILRLDLNDRESMKNAVDSTVKVFGGIDVLVNNAGHGYRAAVEESEPEKVKELFDTDFFAPAELMKMVLPVMRAQKSGLIVNVTSIGAVRGALGNGYYSAAKGALELLTEALAKETEHLGIRTMLVEPGALRTNFYGDGLRGTESRISDYDVLADQYRKENLVNNRDQLGDPMKGGEVIVDTILSGKMPSRLLLGSDAVQTAQNVLKDRLQETENWMDVSRRSDYR